MVKRSWIAIVLSLCCVGLFAGTAFAQAKKPNIVVIWGDDIGEFLIVGLLLSGCVKEIKNNTGRFLGIDRGEKKLATLCHFEMKDLDENNKSNILLLPISYFDYHILKINNILIQ